MAQRSCRRSVNSLAPCAHFICPSAQRRLPYYNSLSRTARRTQQSISAANLHLTVPVSPCTSCAISAKRRLLHVTKAMAPASPSWYTGRLSCTTQPYPAYGASAQEDNLPHLLMRLIASSATSTAIEPLAFRRSCHKVSYHAMHMALLGPKPLGGGIATAHLITSYSLGNHHEMAPLARTCLCCVCSSPLREGALHTSLAQALSMHPT